MSTIRELFDSSRALGRPIEKVITYQNRSDAQLRTEISEYVVTEHIEESFGDLLKKMQSAQQGGGGHEIGAWVSGFYGSGKSSFTKYLGFALDRGMKLGDDTFLHLLQQQLRTAGTKALFNQVSGVYDATIIFLDLASEMLAGASMEEISTVLYLKVLQWAGYSEDLKVSELERMLEVEGRLDEFKARAKEELDGIAWEDVHNQPLVANQFAATLAAEFYPKLFKSAAEFSDLTLHVNKSEIKRAEEMIELIRRKSGKKNILFIIDEVGQYVSAKSSLILNLDGLAKNLKQLGDGSVWLFATAQQTLTEDNPTAALNSPGLFKLQARFPIQVHLEASDIKEICHKRLLTKSAAGEKALEGLFDAHGPSLRTATSLKDAGVYENELSKKTFTALYPFLPAHFEILLQLLGRLAKKTGGLGLRSAIKVVQEVLVEGNPGHKPLADADADSGTLANTVTFYDSLRRDIQSSFGHIVEGVERVAQRLPNEALCLDVAKSIAVLQILENLPVTVQNLAALLQPSVKSPSLKDAVEKAVATLLGDGMIPLGEKNGSLRFLTQTAVILQKKFDEIEYRNADVKAELNGVLRALFKPLPSTRLAGARPVTAGLRVVVGGGQSVPLEGEKEAIQFHVEFAPASSYDATRTEREDDSRSSKERTHLYLLGRVDPEADSLAVILVKCRKFLDSHRTAADAETQDFVRIIESRLDRTGADLERKLGHSLLGGSFIAHGGHEAVSTHGTELLEAAKSFLGQAAAKIYDRYPEAPVQADSSLAEKFLKTPLDRITTNEDPLGLVTRAGGQPRINTAHRALVSISDYLGQNGQVEGRRLADHFVAPPYGWSPDTLRYLLAAAFLGGEIKLRIAGKDHQVKNDESLAAFASNKAFGPVGVSLREVKADPDALLRASTRLTALTGDTVLPLEDEIAASAKRHFPTYQAAFGPLDVELRNFGLPMETAERAERLVDDLIEVISGDGSDAVNRLGGADSPLHEDLFWARQLKKSLDQGLRVRLSHLNRLRREIEALPDFGLPGQLKQNAAEPLAGVDEILARNSFFDESSSLAAHSGILDSLVAATVTDLGEQQERLKLEILDRWQASSDWDVLGEDDRTWFTSEIARLQCEVDTDLDGLKTLLNHDFTLNHRLRDLGDELRRRADAIRKEREKPTPTDPAGGAGNTPEVEVKSLFLPQSLSTAREVQDLIDQLNDHLRAMKSGASIKLTCQVLEEKGS